MGLLFDPLDAISTRFGQPSSSCLGEGVLEIYRSFREARKKGRAYLLRVSLRANMLLQSSQRNFLSLACT